MEIKITSEIKKADGVKAIPNSENGQPLTLRDVCINAVLTPDKDDTQKQKFSDYEIFKRLRDADKEVELTAEEIARIKKKINNIYPALVLGQAYEMLENVQIKK
jgi:hypothetical protein